MDDANQCRKWLTNALDITQLLSERISSLKSLKKHIDKVTAQSRLKMSQSLLTMYFDADILDRGIASGILAVIECSDVARFYQQFLASENNENEDNTVSQENYQAISNTPKATQGNSEKMAKITDEETTDISQKSIEHEIMHFTSILQPLVESVASQSIVQASIYGTIQSIARKFSTLISDPSSFHRTSSSNSCLNLIQLSLGILAKLKIDINHQRLLLGFALNVIHSEFSCKNMAGNLLASLVSCGCIGLPSDVLIALVSSSSPSDMLDQDDYKKQVIANRSDLEFFENWTQLKSNPQSFLIAISGLLESIPPSVLFDTVYHETSVIFHFFDFIETSLVENVPKVQFIGVQCLLRFFSCSRKFYQRHLKVSIDFQSRAIEKSIYHIVDRWEESQDVIQHKFKDTFVAILDLLKVLPHTSFGTAEILEYIMDIDSNRKVHSILTKAKYDLLTLLVPHLNAAQLYEACFSFVETCFGLLRLILFYVGNTR